MKKLNNNDITDILGNLISYQDTLQKALYDHYKNIYELSKTTNYRGNDADTYKTYFSTVSLNYINSFLNLAQEITDTFRLIKDTYFSLESQEYGIISSDTLDDIKTSLTGKKGDFTSLIGEIESIQAEASSYISLNSLNRSEIESEYDKINTEVCNIKSELDEKDAEALTSTEILLEKINSLSSSIKSLSDKYHKDGKINLDMVSSITNEDWYSVEDSTVLDNLMIDDPFAYSANQTSSIEDQWAIGRFSDTYGYAGYNALSHFYDYKRKDGVISANGNASLFSAYGNGQITDYFKLKSNVNLVNGSLSGQAGLSDSFKGFSLKGSVAAAHAEGSLILGSDTCNAYIKGDANALSASGHAEADYKGDLQFDLGVGGKYSAADASFSLGGSLFSVKSNEPDNIRTTMSEYNSSGSLITPNHASGGTATSKSILGIEFTATASIGVEADASLSSQKVLDLDGGASLNAAHIKIKGVCGIGGGVDITFPWLKLF